MTKELADQIAELQMILMDQQRIMEDFSSQLIKVGDRLESVELQGSILSNRLKQIVEEPANQSSRTAEMPPHY